MTTITGKTFDELKKIHWGDVLAILVAMFIFGNWALNRIDRKFDQIEERVEKQNQRTDKLYEMFIDLLKETKKTPSAHS